MSSHVHKKMIYFIINVCSVLQFEYILFFDYDSDNAFPRNMYNDMMQ